MAKLIGIRIGPDAKITRYLLATDHPIGGDKARFFVALGFASDAPDALATALPQHADAHPVFAEREHSRGVNREVRGLLVTPDGRNPSIVTVWFQPSGENLHRFVTAYPG